MESYQDICLLADPEFTEQTLMSALFMKMHLALSARKKGDIGVSFPEHAKTPGAVLRLHGHQEILVELETTQWLAGLSDYCIVKPISAVPDVVGWRTVSRVQVKSSIERLMRRSVSKGWLTEAEAAQQLIERRNQHCDLPFIQLKSHSTGQHFRLFICHGNIQNNPTAGTFGSYGLSTVTTIPWFKADAIG
ncbi:type I-F CRISPR-associated endoribonuclease Cas6/Csy4 [Pseudescherichia sp.]|uniref:type I-F CRISPR-associated endoribonuclease Cas6/Csy4 n=1 Tax=Pseudescherichia sp. TaxID=2055881 RepID=UPI0028A0681C|nr:type I-F CRISPR-associated endoribonuclease Cas6/Csy4 [Pseudescherichia sp.]